MYDLSTMSLLLHHWLPWCRPAPPPARSSSFVALPLHDAASGRHQPADRQLEHTARQRTQLDDLVFLYDMILLFEGIILRSVVCCAVTLSPCIKSAALCAQCKTMCRRLKEALH